MWFRPRCDAVHRHARAPDGPADVLCRCLRHAWVLDCVVQKPIPVLVSNPQSHPPLTKPLSPAQGGICVVSAQESARHRPVSHNEHHGPA
jgi:hypothetical protein